MLNVSLPLKKSFSYRFFAYFATIITGFVALCSQVIWQRYLAILTGSEARSLSLVIAIFLLGLASGYYVFGFLTEKKKWSRFLLLKYYGYLELLTGVYIGLFPIYYGFLKTISFTSPNLFIIDILIACLALLFPSFLMGASIPMLTAALPDNSNEVNTTHAKIYGWNTLGACLGTLVSGFYLIPVFGFHLSLSFIAFLNILVALIFIGNRLKGSIHKQEEIPRIPSPLSNSFLLFFVFVTGALIISFEIIFVRILNLSIGSGVYNFPIILSIFIGGLALGSLSVKKQKFSISFLIMQLFFLLFFLEIAFFTAPYWSIWFNNIRVSLVTLPSNYIVYYVLIYLFLLFFLFPAVFFMGKLLPLVYCLLKKDKTNYGKICGQLYFVNTLGSVFGAIFLGYLIFYFFNLDLLFKLNIYLLFLLTLGLVLYSKKTLNLVVLLVLGLSLLFLPTTWDRTGHIHGYFRTRSYNPRLHFQKLFTIPEIYTKNYDLIFFKDGPNTTVSLKGFFNNQKKSKSLFQLEKLFPKKFGEYKSYSIFVNGKSDGNTLGDFSTVFIMLPYLYAPNRQKLDTAFIGLGTGVSAGSYTELKDVKNIEVLEISPFVIKAIKTTNPNLNFNVMKDKKVHVTETDAFRYFTRNDKTFDVIFSEPSNPWVLGVENLFTKEFYELISKSLKKGGVFGQWFYTYDVNPYVLEIIIKTVTSVFPHTKLYQIGSNDILILASKENFKPLSKKRFKEPFIKKFYNAMGIKRTEDLHLTQIFNSRELDQISESSKANVNTLYSPQLIYLTNKTMFLGSSVNPIDLKRIFLIPLKKTLTKKMISFNRYKNTKQQYLQKRCLSVRGFNFLCINTNFALKKFKIYNDKKRNIFERFDHYLFLNQNNLVPYDEILLKKVFKMIVKTKKSSFLPKYLNHILQYQEYEKSQYKIFLLKQQNILKKEEYDFFSKNIKNVYENHKKLQKALQN